MRTFSSIKDLPVYDKNTGKELGKVLDVSYDHHGMVNGLMIDPKGLMKKNKMIPLAQIASFGKDGVLILSDHITSHDFATKSTVHFLQNGHGKIIGKPLVTTEGEKLGFVEDVYFTEELGTIIGYEVTNGFFADITEGRKLLKADKPLTIGEKILIVDLNEEE